LISVEAPPQTRWGAYRAFPHLIARF